MCKLFHGGEWMIRIIVHGADDNACKYIKLISVQADVRIVAIIAENPSAACIDLARKLHIPVEKSFNLVQHINIDYLVFPTENGRLLDKLLKKESIVSIIKQDENIMYNDFYKHNNFSEILQMIDDGLVVINDQEIIQFINDAACRILGTNKTIALGSNVNIIICDSGLAKTLQTRKKEINQRVRLGNGQEIITTRVPIINQENRLTGAFAYFKAVADVQISAEENTNLKQITATLATLVNTINDAICIVNEKGVIIHSNSAYAELSKLIGQGLIGKQSLTIGTAVNKLHLQIMKTRRKIKEEKIISAEREIIINIEPIIVDGKLRGSLAILQDVTLKNELESELYFSKQMVRNLEKNYLFDDIVHCTPDISLAIEQAKIAANSTTSVLLKGEFGTGKSLLARAIHNQSTLKHHKFIQVNCASLQEQEIEKRLFGFVEETATSEINECLGLFDEANNGTIYLNGISHLPKQVQEKLFCFLQNKTITRVNSEEQIMLNVRVITSNHNNLDKAVLNKLFHEKLFYQLNRFSITIPPLIERIADLPLLISHFIRISNQTYDRNVRSISEQALDQLMSYKWPGNISELENMINSAFILMNPRDTEITDKHLPNMTKQEQVILDDIKVGDLQQVMDNFEKKYLRKVYKQNDFNKTKTAKTLNISVRSLYYKLDKFGLD